jgi:hypothetical protein
LAGRGYSNNVSRQIFFWLSKSSVDDLHEEGHCRQHRSCR